MAHTWKKEEVITAALMNDLEVRADNVGEKGAPGKDGVSLTAIELTKDANGNITGGTATMSDGQTIEITMK